MENPYQVVILDFSPEGHIWRHDFSSYGLGGKSKANNFADTFKALNRFVGKGINKKIKVLVFNTFDGKKLPKEYQNIKPSDYY